MTNYSGSEAYDFSLFEDEGVSYAARQSNAAPKLPEQPQPDTRQIPEPAQLAPKRKANPQPAQEKRHSLLQVLTAVLMSVLVLAGSGILLNRRAEMDGIAASINEINEKIALEESDHVRLLSELNSMFSKREVESYAENVLGMVKLDSYNTIQITIAGEDNIVVSGGKSTETSVMMTKSVLQPEQAAAAPADADATNTAVSAEG